MFQHNKFAAGIVMCRYCNYYYYYYYFITTCHIDMLSTNNSFVNCSANCYVARDAARGLLYMFRHNKFAAGIVMYRYCNDADKLINPLIKQGHWC